VALRDIDGIRKLILSRGNARMFVVGSSVTSKKLGDDIDRIASALDKTGRAAPFVSATTGMVTARLKERGAVSGKPLFVGLVNPNTSSGVFLNSAPNAYYGTSSPDSLRRFLAALLYTSGPHSIFMKTWAAGLAYSNGISAYLGNGRTSYYAERVPELPQTLSFVIDELKKAKPDPVLVEYAIANVFGDSRAGGGYDYRGEAMAADLADELTPDMVRRFRQRILDLRRDPKLTEALFNEMPRVYGEVLPGYGVKAATVRDAVYMVIGPEKQFELYEAYLKRVEGPDAALVRIYPRDFWLTPQMVEP
jgi:hypothetical protein